LILIRTVLHKRALYPEGASVSFSFQVDPCYQFFAQHERVVLVAVLPLLFRDVNLDSIQKIEYPFDAVSIPYERIEGC